MDNSNVNRGRRRATGLIAASAVLVPLSTLVRPRAANAEDLPHLSLDDATAQALKYVEDATTADRPDKMGMAGAEQHCANCQFIQGTDGDAWRPCMLFPGKAVSASGWCTSWTRKPG